MTTEEFTFLLVDDNDLDAERVERTLDRMAIGTQVVRARNGLEALDLMRGIGSGELLGTSYVVLLDLNMPRMTGMEMLADLHDDPGMTLPAIFIMTTSSRPDDICDAYRYGICGYAVKPMDEAEMLRVVAAAREYKVRNDSRPHTGLTE